MDANPPSYLSSTSANALISDLRPTTLSPPALLHINLLLDELLTSLLVAARSINPQHLRISGIPAVFSADKGTAESTGIRALGRAAVGEAELELRSWYEGRSGPKTGFPPQVSGRGMNEMKERSNAPFPFEQAVNLLRIKCVAFSTMAPQTPPADHLSEECLAAWKSAGGDASEETVDPSGLWITAILEHVCEHVLSQLARVVARDSSIAVAGVPDLYVALCEDESVWGFFKRMKVKDSMENAIRIGSGNRARRNTPLRDSLSSTTLDRSSPMSGSPQAAKFAVSAQTSDPPSGGSGRQPSLDSTQHGRNSLQHDTGNARGSFDQAGTMRKVSSTNGRSGTSASIHERSGSVLSASTRSMLGAYNESFAGSNEDVKRVRQDEEDEFDALVKSGETMKVSLTPSRLKTFETAGRKQAGMPERILATRRMRSGSEPFTTEYPTPPLPSSESMPVGHKIDGPYANSARATPPRPSAGTRSGPGLTQRLAPRGATTIEERTDEEDEGSNGRKMKKQSLMELLSSDAPLEDDFQGGGKRGKRTVPAVILAAPPPGASLSSPNQNESSRSTTSNITSPSGLVSSRNVDDDELDGGAGGRRKTRSEARELADFFNSTPPPPNAPTRPVERPSSVKSNKGFKGFMSKVTGRNKEDRRSFQSSSTSNVNVIPTAPQRQKSLASVSGSMTSPPSSFRQMAPSVSETAPPIPNKAVLRKKPESSHSTAAAHVSAKDRGGDVQSDRNPSDRNSMDKTSSGLGLYQQSQTTQTQTQSEPPALPILGMVSAVEGNSTTGPTTPAPLPTKSIGALRPGGKAIKDEMIGPTTPVTPIPEPSNPSTVVDVPAKSKPEPQELGIKSRKAVPPVEPEPTIPVKTTVAGGATATAAAIGLVPVSVDMTNGRLEPEKRSTSGSDVHSFTTANEGEDEVEGRGDATSTAAQAGDTTASASTAPTSVVGDEVPSEQVGEVGQVGQVRSGHVEEHHAAVVGTPEEAVQDETSTIAGGSTIATEEASQGAKPPTSEALLAKSPNIAVPSIPLSHLVPMRNLLTHATSAAECRLLVSAMLSQLGVPPLHHSTTDMPTPESRVTAWLLAGTDGPPNPPMSFLSTIDTPSVSSLSKGDEEEADEPVTPTVDENMTPKLAPATPVALPSRIEDEVVLGKEWNGKGRNKGDVKADPISTKGAVVGDVLGKAGDGGAGAGAGAGGAGRGGGGVGNEEEELLSESASTSSLSKDDEGLPPSFAQAGQRSSPVRVPVG